jgi:hypothetical protein
VFSKSSISTQGDKSPAIQDVKGDVNVTYEEHHHAAIVKSLPKLYKFPPLTRFFSQRDNELIALHTLLQTHKKVVVYGMGGLGKSELVNGYAHKHQADYAHLFWLSAESSDILQAELQQLAQQFGIENEEKWFDLLQVELNRTANSLLILDNLDEFEGEEWKKKLKPIVQALNGCSVALLITSRCEPLRDMAAPLKLELWREKQSRAFLLQRTDKAEPSVPSESEALTQLIAEFAGLPLALEQAGAYIKQKRINFADYWQRYSQEKSKLLSFEGVDLKHQPLLITLQLALEKQSEAARQLFNVCAFLNGDAIPEEIVEALIEGDYTEARNALLDYSLLEQDADNCYLLQHRLLQSLAKLFLSAEEQKQIAEAVIKQVVTLFPNPLDVETWQTCQRLMISALVCDELSRHFVIENEAIAYLYNKLALYLQNRHADYKQALLFHKQAYQLYEKLLGENHLSVANTLNNLALLYKVQYQYKEALPLYLRSLAIKEQQLGENHPDVATSLNNLALLYEEIQSCYKKAVPLYQRSLAIRKQQLGENHPDTGSSYGNSAGVLEATGDYKKALIYRKKALEIHENNFGENHPNVATSLNNLAGLYDMQGCYKEALPLYLRALVIDEKVYGKEHPDVAIDLNNLAVLYKNQSRYSEALPLCLRALAILKKNLGTEHPDTKMVTENYSWLLGKMSES